MKTKFAFSDNTVDGHSGKFLEGPFESPLAEWMGRDGLVFEINQGQRPELAFAALTPLAVHMGPVMFMRLSKIEESMDLAVAKGEDAVSGFDERFDALRTLLEAAPWTLHPDKGLVRSQELWEVVLRGFDGATDETDERVLWIVTSNPDVVRALRDRLGSDFDQVVRTDLGSDAAGVDLTVETVAELEEGLAARKATTNTMRM